MKILVVDDSNFAQRSVIKFMKNEFNDAEFITAFDGEEGYRVFEKEDPDFIFVDLLMPNINGQEFIKMVKSKKPYANIIVMSADIQNNVKEEIIKMNVLSFINKPFNIEKAKIISEKMREIYNA